MKDTITIEDIQVRCRIGVPDEERANPQDLLITLSLETETAKAGQSDDIAQTIDYHAVYVQTRKLAEAREEMRVALATGLEKKNPGAYSFLKAALDVEEAKHSKLVDAARKRDYAKARKSKGVRGDAGLDATLSSGDDDDDVPRVRGSLADLDDPDYRRGPAPSGGERSVEVDPVCTLSELRLSQGGLSEASSAGRWAFTVRGDRFGHHKIGRKGPRPPPWAAGRSSSPTGTRCCPKA